MNLEDPRPGEILVDEAGNSVYIRFFQEDETATAAPGEKRGAASKEEK